ncbi:MAG: hypothetical protein PHC44_05030 [Lutispora sp.]|nr:hypothetical protein [Lutispora sp.]MDD4834080.1 hypothetical protein [Lutispora sp.]
MLGIIDAGGWQNVVELSSGRQVEAGEKEYSKVRKLLKDFPYPGDGNDNSIEWVTNAAQRIVDFHQPHWMLLSYTQPLYTEIYLPENLTDSQNRQKRILDNILNFSNKNGYEPIIVMTGGYMPLLDEITQPSIKGLLESWIWGASVAGVSGATLEDKDVLMAHPHIAQVIDKNDVIAAHPNLHPHFIEYFPSYIVIAKEGYAFRGINSHEGKTAMADVYSKSLPVYSSLDTPQHTKDIRSIMEKALDKGKKVVLVVIEGYRFGNIPNGFTLCDNVDDWYAYRGMDLYLALHTGKPFYETEFPPVYDRSKPKSSKAKYPMSGFFNDLPEDSIGAKEGIKSGAVSSRSMITHMIANADITLECYSRERSHMGLLAAFKPNKL